MLLGDLLQTIKNQSGAEKLNLLLPQNEGAEIDGQTARFVRTKLDENGLERVGIVSFFLEDLLTRNKDHARAVFLCLLAGDLVLLAPRQRRAELLKSMSKVIEKRALTPEVLASVADQVLSWVQAHEGGKTLFALGEPMILYNDVLNNDTFKELEEKGHRILYAPLSEALWSFWYDFASVGENDTQGAETAAAGRVSGPDRHHRHTS